MPLQKKNYARFNVSAMMKLKKEAKLKAAETHNSVQELVKTLDSSRARKKRLETKVILLHFNSCKKPILVH